MDPEAGRPDVPECGQPFRPPSASGLRLTAQLPAAVSRSEPVLTGSVDVTSDRPVHAVIAPQVPVIAVRDGRVVTLPLPQDSVGVRLDLDAGQVVTLAAVGAL